MEYAIITKPFLKWVGGKTQILELVLSQFPKHMHNYHEPFVGGGSVLLGLLSRKDIVVHGTIYASDANEHLIALYKNIQSQSKVLLVIEELEALLALAALALTTGNGTVNRACTTQEEAIASSPESFYYWVRQEFNHMALLDKTSVATSARLLFLNKTCFRGLYREGPNGFNVPYGNYKNPSVFHKDHLLSVSALIRDVVFTHCPFEDALRFETMTPADFVYLDPPYVPKHKGSFLTYNVNGFSKAQHTKLFALCKAAAPIKLLMSNADDPFIHENFSHTPTTFNTTVFSCRRAIHSRSPDSVVNEVLIKNF